jgi:hypothetical protein
LNIVDNISITDNSVDNSISIQAGQNGSVGSFFGLDYESTTNQDFIIQSTSSGSIKYKQYGIGATTKTMTFNPEEIIMANTANNNTNTITETQIEVKQDPTSTTTPSTTTITPQQTQLLIHNNITNEDSTATLNAGALTFAFTGTPTTTLSKSGVSDGTSSATWTDIIAGGSGTTPTLQQVLNTGNTCFNSEILMSANNTGVSTTGTYRASSLGFTSPTFYGGVEASGINFNAQTGSNSVSVQGTGIIQSFSDSVGGLNTPQLRIENRNTGSGTTGSNGVEFYKNKVAGGVGAVGDIISSIGYYAKNYLGTKTLFGKMESIITSTSAGAGDDGALDFYTAVNGVISLVFRMNGADNENNSFRPLDMNGNAIKSSTAGTPVSIQPTASTGLNITSTTGTNQATQYVKINAYDSIYNNSIE